MIRSPAELFVYELSAILDAETQASQGQLLMQEVTRGLECLGGQTAGRQNIAARGLVEEAQTLLKAVEAPEMKQAVLTAGVQKLEHYCIAAWGTMRAIANELGQQDLARATQGAVDEGYCPDRELSNLAGGWVNPTAIEQADLAEGEEEQETRSAAGQPQHAACRVDEALSRCLMTRRV